MSYSEPMTPSKKEIKEWLKNIGKDRFWLANQCRVEKVTIDKWLSSERDIPSKALLIIQNLMAEKATVDSISDNSESSLIKSLEFSEEEMKVVRQFQKNFPGIDLESYLRNKVIELCAGLDKQNKFLIEIDEPASLVAEDTDEYGKPVK